MDVGCPTIIFMHPTTESAGYAYDVCQYSIWFCETWSVGIAGDEIWYHLLLPLRWHSRLKFTIVTSAQRWEPFCHCRKCFVNSLGYDIMAMSDYGHSIPKHSRDEYDGDARLLHTVDVKGLEDSVQCSARTIDCKMRVPLKLVDGKSTFTRWTAAMNYSIAVCCELGVD